MDEHEGTRDRRKVWALPALIALAFIGGLAVIGAAGALDSEDCTPGGYGPPCLDDAELVVEPGVDLVDGQFVTVTGILFDPPWGTFVASQCAAQDLETNGQDNCDSRTITYGGVNGAGNVWLSMRVHRIIETAAFGEVDCADEGACVIGAASVSGSPDDFEVIEGVSVPVAFDPAVPPIDYTDGQIFVDPATDLVDRQTVTVTGTDIDPQQATFGAAQCDAALVEALQIGACDLSTARTTSVGDDGTVTLEMPVRRIITTDDGELDCADAGACVIGAGSVGDDSASILEGGVAPIAFDPEVPPVPPLELEIVIDEVTAAGAAGTVVCNREASAYLNGQIEQTKGGRTATANGYLPFGLVCDVEPTEWELPWMYGGRRFVGGPATLTLFGSAYDGFESVSHESTDDVRLPGGPQPEVPFVEAPGVETSIAIVDATGQGDDQTIVVEVDCGRAVPYASVNVWVRQWAGLDLATAYGYASLDGCDGLETVEVPLSPGNGVVTGGPAQVQASVQVYDPTPPDYFGDYATTGDTVRLAGQLRWPTFDPTPNPGSRITIDNVSRSAITGTVECEEPAQLDLYGDATQTLGRTSVNAYGYTDFVDCSGVTPFTIEFSASGDALRGGRATVSVRAFSWEWFDYQEDTVRVR